MDRLIRSRACGWVPGLRAGVAGMLLMLACASAAHPQSIARPTFGANGAITAMTRSGDTLFVGGTFTQLGLTTGGFARFDAGSGSVSVALPRVDGTVSAIASDGSGGYYIGGLFAGVNGIARTNAARILADGSVAAWDPRPDREVLAIAVSSSRVYLGGRFLFLNGRARQCVAGVDPITGVIADSVGKKARPSAIVYDLALANGALLMGGNFAQVEGVVRRGIASLDPSDGSLRAWQPTPSLPSGAVVHSIVPRGATILIGGDFTWVPDASTRADIAEIDAVTGAPTAWAPSGTNGRIFELLADGGTIYCAGDFTTFNGINRFDCAAVDAATGAVKSFDPRPLAAGSSQVNSLSLGASGLLLGGSFTQVGDSLRTGLAVVDPVTGAPRPWNAGLDHFVFEVLADGAAVVAGGDFNLVNQVPRARLGAIDLVSGRPLSWRCDVSGGYPFALQAGPGTLYVGGQFESLGGQLRHGLGAVSRQTGQVTAWNPVCNGVVYSLLIKTDRLYVGGSFSGFAPQINRDNLAALDLVSGTPLPWDPHAMGSVRTLCDNGRTIYVGGSFTGIGFLDGNGQPVITPRGLGAEIDTSGIGSLTPWNPSVGQSFDNRWLVLAIVRPGFGNKVVLVGSFYEVGGTSRRDLAIVDAQSGALDPMNHSMPIASDNSAIILSVDCYGPLLYLGGHFSTWTNGIQNSTRVNLAVMDLRDGTLRDWTPSPNNNVWRVIADRKRLLIGGEFARAENERHIALADFDVTGFMPLVAGADPIGRPASILLRPCYPNPVRGSTSIGFEMPSEEVVSLEVFDVQGRRVALPIDRARMASGRHEIRISTRGWPAGVYLYRLRAAGTRETRQMVVVK